MSLELQVYELATDEVVRSVVVDAATVYDEPFRDALSELRDSLRGMDAGHYGMRVVAHQTDGPTRLQPMRCPHWRVYPPLIDVQCAREAGHLNDPSRKEHINGPEAWNDAAGEWRPTEGER